MLAGALLGTWPHALFAVCCVSTVVRLELFISSKLFYGSHHHGMGGSQMSMNFFPEKPCETEEGEEGLVVAANQSQISRWACIKQETVMTFGYSDSPSSAKRFSGKS